ncbi:MAG: metabolite traffic protein EboE [Leptolyngbyaceae bacterium]|nr:metabolite traffic protein EboE [Leptolyngbyaceae bacterium]
MMTCDQFTQTFFLLKRPTQGFSTMRIAGDRPYHLTYCTNIHPGEEWPQVFHNLQRYIPALKQQLSPHEPFGIGLRLSDSASRALLTDNALSQFQDWLAETNTYVFTLNGFPYGGFHHQVVKDKVYAPDWSTGDRQTYTQRLITLLSALVPEGMDGGISTVPLSYKPWHIDSKTKQKTTFERSSHHLADLAAEMAHLEETTGKVLHLDLEPEPDALLENSDEVIAFFQEWLLPVGSAHLQKHHGVHSSTAEQWLRRHLRVCYDTCHFAVEYEDPSEALAKFNCAGITIGKFQLSSAIRIPIPSELPERKILAQKLEPFAESTYLHQVIERRSPHTLHHYPDLSDALPSLLTTQADEWRTHFHVPIFIDKYPPFSSTQDHITDILRQLPSVPDCTHLEIETYTWDVLPSDMKLDILASIQREYEWVLSNFSNNRSSANRSSANRSSAHQPVSVGFAEQ